MLHGVGLNDATTVAYHHHHHPPPHHPSLNHHFHHLQHPQFGSYVSTTSMPCSFTPTDNCTNPFGQTIPRSLNGMTGSAAVTALTAAAAVSAGIPPNIKDSRWLTLEVCRQFQRNQCSRDENECKFAHPPTHVDVQSGRVVCCFDSIKGKCQRRDPPCKYLHPPHHLREQLIQNGRNNMIMRNVQFQLLQQQFLAQSGVVPLSTGGPNPVGSQDLNQNSNNLANNLNSFLFATRNGLSALSNQPGPPTYSLFNMGFSPYLSALNTSPPGPVTNLIHSLPNLNAPGFVPNESCLKRSSLPETKTDLSTVYHYPPPPNNNNNNNNNHHHHHHHTNTSTSHTNNVNGSTHKHRNQHSHPVPRTVGINCSDSQTDHLQSVDGSNLDLEEASPNDCASKSTPNGHSNQTQQQPNGTLSTYRGKSYHYQQQHHTNSTNSSNGSLNGTNHPSPNGGYMTINYTLSSDQSNNGSVAHQNGGLIKTVGICQNALGSNPPSSVTPGGPGAPVPATYFNLGLAPPPHHHHHPNHLSMSATSFAVASLAAAAANGIYTTLPHQNNTTNFPLALAEPHAYFQTAYPIEIPTYYQ